MKKQEKSQKINKQKETSEFWMVWSGDPNTVLKVRKVGRVSEISFLRRCKNPRRKFGREKKVQREKES